VSYILFTNGWNAARYASLTIADWLAAVMTLFAILGIAQRCVMAWRLEQRG
jgi:hypothetical protein